MAKKPTITTIASGYYSRQALNTNFENLRDSFDNTLSLDGSTPNAMGADLDMNSNDILNVNTLAVADLTVAGLDVNTALNSAVSASAASAVASAASAGESAVSASSAALYDGPWVDDVASLLADTTLTLTPGQPNSVVIGDYVRTRKEGFAYQVATVGDVTTAGGIQLDVMAGDGVKHAAAYGVTGDGVTLDRPAVQAALNSLASNETLSFAGLTKCMIDDYGINLMRNASWKTGYTTTERRDITIDFAGCIMQFTDDVSFSAAFPNIPIVIRPASFAATQVRQAKLFTCSLDGLTILNAHLDNNMQARGANLGLPGALEQEHCLMLVSCKDTLVRDIVTQDSMGDGINIAYPYKANQVGDHQFFGAESLDGLCERITVQNHKAYRHSRLGISVVGCNGAVFDNLYAEDIRQVTNYQSLAGPGSVIDIEYDKANSWYDSLGFSLCENISINNVYGKNCGYGGAVQVQNGRHIAITNVVFEGDSSWGLGRIEGDPTTNNGAKNVSLNGFKWLGGSNTASNTIGRFGGDNVSIRNIDVSGVALNVGFDLQHSRDLVIDGVSIDVKMNDATGSIIAATEKQDNLFVNNFTAKLTSDSAIRQPILLSVADNTARIKGFTMIAPDAAVVSGLGRGIVHLTSTGNTVEVEGSNFDIKAIALYTAASRTGNSVSFKNTRCKGMAYFPSVSRIDETILEGVTVHSMWNDGAESCSSMFVNMENNIKYHVKDVSIYSEGAYGYNKTKVSLRFTSTAADVSTVTGAEFYFDGLTIIGGRQSDGVQTAQCFENGVSTTKPYTVAALRAMFKVRNTNLGNLGAIEFVTGATDVSYAVGNSNGSTFLPNQPLTVTLLDSYEQPFYVRRSTTDQNRATVQFASALTAPQKFMVK